MVDSSVRQSHTPLGQPATNFLHSLFGLRLLKQTTISGREKVHLLSSSPSMYLTWLLVLKGATVAISSIQAKSGCLLILLPCCPLKQSSKNMEKEDIRRLVVVLFLGQLVSFLLAVASFHLFFNGRPE